MRVHARILVYDEEGGDALWIGNVSHVPREGERVALWDRSPVVTLVVERVVLRLPEDDVYVHGRRVPKRDLSLWACPDCGYVDIGPDKTECPECRTLRP